MRAGPLAHLQALFPEPVVVGAVEGNDDELFALCR